MYVQGSAPRRHYAYRVDGPADLHGQGFRYNRNKVLIDPYALGNTNALWNRAEACGPDDNLATSMRSVVIDIADYDWEGDRPLDQPMNELVIYEMHVGGFTRHPSSGVAHPGTFSGVIEKIPYLKELGVTAVELLPVMEFDRKEVLRMKPDGSGPLTNYWGYSTVSFFAPESSYCVSPEQGRTSASSATWSRPCTGPGSRSSSTPSSTTPARATTSGRRSTSRASATRSPTILSPSDRQYYMDYSGCGNTVNCNHPVVQKFIIECLEFWVKQMHVDGFRFDEGSILSRGEDGVPMVHPPVVWSIELSESLLDAKMIAEAWDAAGLYQIGYFPGYRWAEWNGRFRDDVRRFVRGDPGLVGAVASRIGGQLRYLPGQRPPAHQQRQLRDLPRRFHAQRPGLVQRQAQRGQRRGQPRRHQRQLELELRRGRATPTTRPSRPCGAGRSATSPPSCSLAQGVPMILAGDEIRQTQRGNNNAYCQDNEISWFDWKLLKKHGDLFRFWKLMIDFRKRHPALHRSRFFDGKVNDRGLPDVAWHGCQLLHPGWDDPNARALAFTLAGFGAEADIHVMFNMDGGGLDFEIPVVKGRQWHLAVDTAQPAPCDIAEPGQERPVLAERLRVQGRSVMVLVSR